jgi:DHA1 family bicyclomycin/chloramphenicol resistance-like MFS transporter
MSADKPSPKRGPGFRESIALLALMISLVALSMDIMLPALPDIGRDLSVRHPNDAQLVISVLILGLSLGQLFYGPLSDSTGRKPAIFVGIIIFTLGCLLSIFATHFGVMLAGRFMQGIGAAGPRSVIIALVRDQYAGRAMARMMSAVMAVFIVVPAVAPAIGQVILLVANWRVIFGALMMLAMIALIWFTIRQPETLPQGRRLAFSVKTILMGVVEICTNRIALGYTLAAGFIFGAFLGYLNSAQQVFQEVYDLGRQFPLYMGVLALFFGGASYCNSRIVMRFGMRTLSRWALMLLIVISVFYLTVVYLVDGHSSLWILVVFFALAFFCLGILFGNLNAIAMEPLGHIAGVGAAVVGSISTLVSVPFAIVIGRGYDGTTLPLVSGFAILSILAAFTIRWADSK